MKINIDKALSEFTNKGYVLEVIGNINLGKDASVWKVCDAEKKEYALKIYKENTHYNANENNKYDKHNRYRNFGKRVEIPTLNSKVNSKYIKWEFGILKDLYRDQAFVPEVFAYTSESILMQFIGDESPAPMLKDIELSKEDATTALEQILDSVEIFLTDGVVHAELTDENVLWNEKEKHVCIIDFPQALDTRLNENFPIFLRRDIDYMIQYFQKFITITDQDIKGIYKRFYVDV